jgi:predicted enzyme related to lactoylglutathione lyase
MAKSKPITSAAITAADRSRAADARPETLAVVEAPGEIPGGFMATYQDPDGATIYVMNQATDSATE